jgi:hypothetical protein
MKEWNPKSVWDELRKTFERWTREDDEDDEDDDRRSVDVSLLFHLMLTVPLLIAILSMARR